jgi:hypothetical protein
MDKSDHYNQPSRRGLVTSLGIGMSIRNLMASMHEHNNDEDKEDNDGDSFGSPGGGGGDDDFLFDSPNGEQKTTIANTQLGQSLLTLVNTDDSALSPTSQSLKKLSAEVFGM